MNNIEAAITKEINDMCSLPCYGATNATEEEQQRGRLAGLTWALNLVVQTQSKAGRHDVDFWRCQACGCLWRDNHDGTVSLGGPTQKSCAKCEYDTPRECEPLYRALTGGTSSGSAGQEASRPANDPIRAAVNAAWGLYSETFVLAIREQLVTDLCAHHPNGVHTFEYICHECQEQDIDDKRVEVGFHQREVVHLTKERDALQKDVERLTEAARSVLIGFDQGVFVRSIQDDSNPLWALRLLPFIRALATLQHLLGVDGGALGDAHEVTTPANHKEQSIASAPRGGGETRPEIPKK